MGTVTAHARANPGMFGLVGLTSVSPTKGTLNSPREEVEFDCHDVLKVVWRGANLVIGQ